MKKILLIIPFLFPIKNFAQLSTTNINFNNYVSLTNNDLKNNFVETVYYNLAQNGSNYYIETPLQGTPTQPLKLCSKYKGISSETMSISIDYKLDLYPTVGGTSNGVGIFIAKNTNETILAARIYNQELNILGLTNPNSTYSPFLMGSAYSNGTWYRLTFEITQIATNKYSVTTKIFSLGLDGASSPTQVATNTIQGFNYDFKTTDIVNINLVGGWWGDVRYIDNFSIYGFKDSSSNCQSLAVNESEIKNQINVYPNPFSNFINLKGKYSIIELYDYSGKLIKLVTNPQDKINLESLKKGVYLLKIHTNDRILTEKIVKE